MKYDFSGADRQYSVAEFVEANLDGRSYEGGQLEALESSFTKTSEFLGRLMQTLADKELLTRAEIYKIITNGEED